MALRSRWLWLSPLIAAAFGLTALRFLVAPLDRYDEGVAVTKAMLAAAGQVPYRDFWMTYGPLDTYVLAGAFRLFGQDVLVERGAAIAVAWLFLCVAFWVTGALGLRGAMRLLITGTLGLPPLSVPAFNSAVIAGLIGMVAVLAFSRSLQPASLPWAAAAGGLTALASFARPEFAAALGLGFGAGYVVTVSKRQSLLRLLLYGGVTLAAALVLWLPLLAAAGIGPVRLDLITHAFKLYGKARSIPLFRSGDVSVLVFSAGFALVWLWAGIRLIRLRADPREAARLLGLLTIALLTYSYVLGRADGHHALSAWPMTGLLLAILVQRRSRPQRPPARIEGIVSVAAVLVFSLAPAGLVWRDLDRPATDTSASVPRATLVGQRAWMPAPQLVDVLQAVNAGARPAEPIFVGLERNDRVVFNDTMLYFLSGHPPATVYFESLPGFANADLTERIVVCQLERAGLRLAVLGPNPAGEPWNLSSREGSTYLDEWLKAHTLSRTTIGPYDLLLVGTGPPPATCPAVSPDSF